MLFELTTLNERRLWLFTRIDLLLPYGTRGVPLDIDWHLSPVFAAAGTPKQGHDCSCHPLAKSGGN
jgi:hypothetical protein